VGSKGKRHGLGHIGKKAPIFREEICGLPSIEDFFFSAYGINDGRDGHSLIHAREAPPAEQGTRQRRAIANRVPLNQKTSSRLADEYWGDSEAGSSRASAREDVTMPMVAPTVAPVHPVSSSRFTAVHMAFPKSTSP